MGSHRISFRRRLYAVLMLVMLYPFIAQARSVPDYSSKLGLATSSLIGNKVNARGFAATDPRFTSTVNGVGAAITTIAGGLATGVSWPAVLAAAGISAVATVAIPLLADKAITWIWGNGDQAQVSGSDMVATVPNTPIYGTSTCNNSCVLTHMSPGEQRYFNTATSGVVVLLMLKLVTGATWSYSGMLDMSGSPIAIAPATGNYWKSIMVQTGGYTKVDGSTVSAPTGGAYVMFLHYPPTGQQEMPSYLPQMKPTAQIFLDIPQPALASPMSNEALATIANAQWRAASLQLDYPGLPYDATNPITAQDVAVWRATNPSSVPTLNDYFSPALNPTTGKVDITTPTTNPNASNTAPTGTAVNLGTDPGVTAPTLETPPTDLFKPISDLMQLWLSWAVPDHDGACPTWQASPSISGHIYNIDLSYHCTFAESYRSAITAAALACWFAIAAFIILSA